MEYKTYSAGLTPKKVLVDAINGERYSMSLVGEARDTVTAAVNEGIDSYLEAFTDSTFDDDGHRLRCDVGPDDMLVLLRRLDESGDPDNLRGSILSTLDIEEV